MGLRSLSSTWLLVCGCAFSVAGCDTGCIRNSDCASGLVCTASACARPANAADLSALDLPGDSGALAQDTRASEARIEGSVEGAGATDGPLPDQGSDSSLADGDVDGALPGMADASTDSPP